MNSAKKGNLKQEMKKLIHFKCMMKIIKNINYTGEMENITII